MPEARTGHPDRDKIPASHGTGPGPGAVSNDHEEYQVLINCVAYGNGKRMSEIPVEDISDYIAKPDCFVWVALRDATPHELDQMQEEFGLHELAVEDARHGHQRPKIEGYDDSLFAVLHLLDYVAGELRKGEVSIFVGKNFVLSVRSHAEQNFHAVRERCEHEAHLLQQGAGFVFYALMDAIVDRYFPIIDALESELEEIEGRIFAKGGARANIERLYDLKRKVTVIKHAVAPLMEAIGRLIGAWSPAITTGCREYLRDVLDHLTRINTSLDTIRDTIGTAIQVNLSMVTIEENEVNKRLAAWAGIFAAATALAGIWGMNFKAMPELDWEYGYPFALAAIASVSGFLYWRFKRAGWL